MCNVSMIMDTYRPYVPNPHPVTSPPFGSPFAWPMPSPTPGVEYPSAKEVRELIDSFKEAVEAAKAFDRLTGQPDCEDPEKAELIERVAELERRLAALEQ